MNTFDLCKNIRNALLSRAGQVAAYSNSWGADFCVREIAGLRDDLKKREKWFREVDANDLTASELDELSFRMWSDEIPIRLIPIWLLPYLRDEIKAQCINGQPVTSVKDMDNDVRFGCVAYGVIPKAD